MRSADQERQALPTLSIARGRKR